MSKQKASEVIKKNSSLTEWFEAASLPITKELIIEDSRKKDRLQVLNEIADFPIASSTEIPASLAFNETSIEIENLKNKYKGSHCGLRVNPITSNLKRFRIRGKSVEDSLSWLKSLDLDFKSYNLEFLPHVETPKWSTIFVSTPSGISGEIINDGHHLLTQGLVDNKISNRFQYKNGLLQLDRPDANAEDHLRAIIEILKIDQEKVQLLKSKESLNPKFFSGVIGGYFETIMSDDWGLWFVDYNRILGDSLINFNVTVDQEESLGDNEIIKGLPVSSGKARGIARIINEESRELLMNGGEILLVKMTNPDHIPMMVKSSGIITQFGGMLSHAAIVCRELGKPCISGIDNLFDVINDGDLIEIDGNKGEIKILTNE